MISKNILMKERTGISLGSLIETTQTLCPICLKIVEGQVLEREGKVYLRRNCPDHGIREGIISSDIEMYQEAERFNKPGTVPLQWYAHVERGCPYDCGICPEHQQHTCLAVLEITNACNMRCPTCFASSGTGEFLELATIEKMMESFVRAEKEPEVLMISGGEPTLHPDLMRIMRMAREKGIRHVVLNTNGQRIVRDPSFAEALARERPTLYLQFDGFKPQTHSHIRGDSDLLRKKTACIERCEELDIPLLLVMTVEKFVNDDEIGETCLLAMRTPIIKGVVYQPTFYSGRHPGFDPMDRMTLPEVVHKLVGQTGGMFQIKDFIPDPCPYPTCGSTTYIHVENNEVIPLPQILDVEDYLDYIKNRAIPDPKGIVQEALEGLWSASTVPGTNETAKLWCDACGIGVDVEKLQDRIKMIKVKPFMDAWTFDVKRIKKCCVHEITPEGKLVPFCAYNTIPQYRAEILGESGNAPVKVDKKFSL
jgi:uncharacterized radical SAM superfamily Fe-S cluster-containing enzyme